MEKLSSSLFEDKVLEASDQEMTAGMGKIPTLITWASVGAVLDCATLTVEQ